MTVDIEVSEICDVIRKKKSDLNSEIEKKSAVRSPEEGSALQKHCAFFDFNKDGLIHPWETYQGMRILGSGIILAIFTTIIIHLFGSYPTQKSWIPDPLFSIRLDNVHRLRHGSDTGVYNSDGNIRRGVNVKDAFPTVTDPRGITPWDIMCMPAHRWDVYGWCQSRSEWLLIWALWHQNGYLSWDAAISQFDGTLFSERANRSLVRR